MVAIHNHSLNHNDPVLESPTLQAEPGLMSTLYFAINGTVHLHFLGGNMTVAAISAENTTVCLGWPHPATKLLITAKSEQAEVGPIHFGDYSCDTAVNGECTMYPHIYTYYFPGLFLQREISKDKTNKLLDSYSF